MKNNFTKLSRLIAIIASLLISTLANATTYYSRTNGGSWSVNTTWSTVTYGNVVNTGTFPKAGDIVNIGDGYTIYITANVGCATLNIGEGASGILAYQNTGNYTFTVTGSITLNNGAIFEYTGVNGHTQTLDLGGNLTNLGSINFYSNFNDVVNILFNQSTNSLVSGSGAWTLNTVTLTKTTSTAASLDVQTNSFETAIKTLTATYGTYIHDNAGTYNVNPSVANYTIGPNVIFQVPQGTLGFATTSNSLTIQGQLNVNGGDCVVGSSAGTQGIFSDQNGATVANLTVSAGTLTVYGGITYAAAAAAKPFRFNMSGGNILLNSGTTGTSREVFYINDEPLSQFVMSGGTITLQKPNTTGASTIDVSICGNNGTVTTTGGTIQFGNGSTTAGKIFNFKPLANATYPNFLITGKPGTAFSLATSSGSTANFNLYSLYIDVGKTFDIQSISGAPGDNKTMTLMGTWNGIQAFTNYGTFTARTSTVQFNSAAGPQSIGGTITTNFYNLTINNNNNMTLDNPENVTNALSMVIGVLYTTGTNILTLTNTATSNIGSASAYVDGPMVCTVASINPRTLTYPIAKTGSYRPVVLTVQHSTAASVTYKAEIFNNSAMGLPYVLPATISKVSTVRYVQFTRQNVNNFSNGKIQMYYGPDDGVTDYTALLVAHDNGVNLWQNFGGAATANGTGNIKSNTFTNFHTYFALGNPPGGNNALPISLLDFNAYPVSNYITVAWQTASELNNNYFTVEHSSDNMNFSPFATVNGAGTSNQVVSYSVNDYGDAGASHYYRLKQTDYNGNFSYSQTVLVLTANKGYINVSPNPVTGSSTHISFQSTTINSLTVRVSDLLGKTVSEITYPANEFGAFDFNLDMSAVSNNGIYMLQLICGNETETQKLLVTGK